MIETRSARRTVYRGRALTLHVDDVVLPDGRPAVREVVEHPGSVVLVPVEAGEVLLVCQYRYSVERDLLELPAGTLRPGEDPLAAAARELAEETGFAATELGPLAKLFPSPGFTSEVMWIYLARGLRPEHAEQDEDENIELVRMPFEGAVARARAGSFDDMKTVAGLLLAAERV